MKQHITTKQYQEQQANCDDLCNVTDSLVVERDEMKCVTCPFCKEIVTAILTPKTITCPKCKVVVNR